MLFQNSGSVRAQVGVALLQCASGSKLNQGTNSYSLPELDAQVTPLCSTALNKHMLRLRHGPLSNQTICYAFGSENINHAWSGMLFTSNQHVRPADHGGKNNYTLAKHSQAYLWQTCLVRSQWWNFWYFINHSGNCNLVRLHAIDHCHTFLFLWTFSLWCLVLCFLMLSGF